MERAIAAVVALNGRGRSGRNARTKHSPIQRQKSLAQMLVDIPTAWDRGTKCVPEARRFLGAVQAAHIDSANCVISVSVLLSVVSMCISHGFTNEVSENWSGFN